MAQSIIDADGNIYLDVTEKAKEVFSSGLFSISAISAINPIPIPIETNSDLNIALEDAYKIGILAKPIGQQILVLTVDKNHCYSSRDVIGVAFNIEIAIDICKKHAYRHNKCLISYDDLFNLRNIKQTQNFEGTGEYALEFIESNTLI